MSISEHPPKGTILMCDFNTGFREPEMVKRRPVIVISPYTEGRGELCTVVALSATPPEPVKAYHTKIILPPNFPEWLLQDDTWVKGDMVNAVSFRRLETISSGKNKYGKRIYCRNPLNDDTMRIVETCIFRALGQSKLTKHL